MSANIHSHFFQSALNPNEAQSIVDDALAGMDDGELFLEHTESESLVFDDGRLKNASSNISRGFGLRSVMGEAIAYAHASDISEPALRRAAETVKAVQGKAVHTKIPAAFGANHALYTSENPLNEVAFPVKLEALQSIDAYLRAKDARVKQVSASLVGSWQVVHIMRAGGEVASDVRPLVRLNISVVVEENGRMETGSSGAGGRTTFGEYLQESRWKNMADDALRQAIVNLKAIPAPAGEMPVVLASGWCGVLLHEAVGHGLEGDCNRKGTSAFAGLMGKQIATKGVTVVDDGTIEHRRGSLTIDDEGTPTARNILIEDGMLTGFMQDKQNARLMGLKPTGNGRRESYACQPIPRMTNTMMLSGNDKQADIISSVKRGIFATHFGGGQVDTTSGKFVFSASEAYLIENGKVTSPIKGATLIGNGPDALKRIVAIGDDACLDDGIGTCGKQGQSVPVGVGQPSMLIDKMTVGGTAV